MLKYSKKNMRMKIMNELICKLTEFESFKMIVEDNINFNQIDFCCSEFQVYFLNKKNLQLCIGE